MAESLRPGEFFPKEWREYLNKKRDCTEQMTLGDFLLDWNLTNKELALICECSVVTVNHWFVQGKSHRSPNLNHRRRLAEAYRELDRMKQSWVNQRYDFPTAHRVVGAHRHS